jgi:hypothetical protein
MSRSINDHIINPCNDKIRIEANDQPGAGGANHRYEITGFDTANNPSIEDPQGYRASFSKQVILFQNGPITGRGANLAIIDDPIKGAEDADSEAMSAMLWDWYTSVHAPCWASSQGIIRI